MLSNIHSIIFIAIALKGSPTMVSDIDDDFLDDSSDSDTEADEKDESSSNTLTEKKIQEQAQKNLLARKRIEELREQKLLKSLLDDSEDW